MTVYFLGWKAQYEQLFIDHLAESYDVVYLEQSRVWNRVNRLVGRFLGGRWQSRLALLYAWRSGFSANDLLICNEGEIHRKFNAPIVGAFPGVKLLLIRDLVDSDFVIKWTGLFDAMYSFDRKQCEVLGIKYLHQFFPMGFAHAKAVAPSYQCAAAKALFIGRDKGRGQVLIRLAETLVECGCEVDFRILVDRQFSGKTKYHVTELVDYRDYVLASAGADVIVEVNQSGQAGVTLRALEAAYFGKKLITTNSSVRELSFYNPCNFYILDDCHLPDVEGLKRFLASTVEPVASSLIYEYSPEHMLETLMRNHGYSG